MEHPYFIAILRLGDQERSGYHEYAIYYVNNTDHDLYDFSIDSGAFFTADDDPVTLSSTKKTFGTLKAKHHLLIEYEGYGLDETIIQYHVHFQVEGESVHQTFTLGKGLRGGVKPFSKLPVIKEFGYLFKPDRKAV